jgi:hypothetical protein
MLARQDVTRSHGASGRPRSIQPVHDLLVALAGGAIGAVVTGIGFAIVWLSAVPGEVARHDRLAKALDEDLERWVADAHRRLRQDLSRVTNRMNARGQFYSGPHLVARAETKTRALQRYRNRLSRAERALAHLIGEEGWTHERWRRWRTHTELALHAPERLEPVINDWRGRVSVPGMEDRGPVHDPTRWTTNDLVRDARDNPLDRPT